jgi:hypothetical protein
MKRALSVRCGGLLLLLVPWISSAGQSPAETVVPRGARVRVTAPAISQRPLLGMIQGVDRDSVVWQSEPGDSLIAWPLAAVAKLEVSQGQRANTWRFGGIGALMGAVAGALVGAVAGNDDCPEGGLAGFAGASCLTRAEAAAAGAVTGILLGGGVGLLIGSGKQSERWSSVSPGRLRVAAGLGPHERLAIAGVLTF